LALLYAQPIEEILEFGFVDFNEIPAIERIDTGPNLLTQRLELQGILLAALLERTKCVSDRFASVLILAGLDDILNKRILLSRQADVPSRHDGTPLSTAR